MYHVYRIINNINHKSYIGITSRSSEIRLQEHIARAKWNMTRNNRLCFAMRKYGWVNFDVVTLGSANSKTKIRKMETEFIKQYDSYNDGYNCNHGGVGSLDISDETKQKIRQAQLGKVISLEARRKQSLVQKGNKKNFGEYILKGKDNPQSKYYLVEFPDGHSEMIQGLRQFCRDHDLQHCKLSARKRTKQFTLLRTFRDYSERKYTQASGNGGSPTLCVGE